MGFWFNCKHKNVSVPHLKQSITEANRGKQEYVVDCLDCKKSLPYTPSAEESRILEQLQGQGEVPVSDVSADSFWGKSGIRLQKLENIERSRKNIAPSASPQVIKPVEVKPAAAVGTMSLVALHRLATLHHDRKNYAEAESIYRDVLKRLKNEESFSGIDSDQVLANLALLLAEEKRYSEAEATYKKAIHELTAKEGEKCPKLVRRMAALAELQLSKGDTLQAQMQFQRALLLADDVLPADHVDLQRVLRGYVEALRRGNRHENAADVEARLEHILNHA